MGGLLLFDITNRRSFQNVHDWLEEARSHVQPHSIVFLLVGHKCDLEAERQVRPRGKKTLDACLKHGRLLSLAKSVAPKIERYSHLDHSLIEDKHIPLCTLLMLPSRQKYHHWKLNCSGWYCKHCEHLCAQCAKYRGSWCVRTPWFPD